MLPIELHLRPFFKILFVLVGLCMALLGGLGSLYEPGPLEATTWLMFVSLIVSGLLMAAFGGQLLMSRLPLLVIEEDGIRDNRVLSRLAGKTFIRWPEIQSVSLRVLPYGQRLARLRLRDGSTRHLGLTGFRLPPRELFALIESHASLSTTVLYTWRRRTARRREGAPNGE